MSTVIPHSDISKLSKRIERSVGLFITDIDAMPEEQLAQGCGGKSRCGYDLAYELVSTFNMFTNELEAKPNEPFSFDGWTKAPAAFKNKETAKKELKEASRCLLGALEAFRGDLDEEKFTAPFGKASARDLVDAARVHTMYHSGQLNYIQTIHGDDAFHWNVG